MPLSRESIEDPANPLYVELSRLRGIVSEQVMEISSLKINEFVERSRRGEYEDAGLKIGTIVTTKQKAYGDSFGKIGAVLQFLYPDGIDLDQYNDLAGVVRNLDKLFRIATDRDALGESPWLDISGYGLLGQVRVERERRGKGNAGE